MPEKSRDLSVKHRRIYRAIALFETIVAQALSLETIKEIKRLQLPKFSCQMDP